MQKEAIFPCEHQDLKKLTINFFFVSNYYLILFFFFLVLEGEGKKFIKTIISIVLGVFSSYFLL